MTYKIMIDASADINPLFCERNDIAVIPMEYSLDDRVYIYEGCMDESSAKEFYRLLNENTQIKTSQVNPFCYEEVFEPYVKSGISLLYLCLSSGLSSTINSARTAAAVLKQKYENAQIMIIDTFAAAGGIGILAERAARNRESGMDISENCSDLISAISRLNHWFIVDDLIYLKKGGRIDATTAFVGSALMIKPILKIDGSGKLQNVAKAHGTNATVKKLLEIYKETSDDSSDDPVYICHSSAEKTADKLEADVLSLSSSTVIRKMLLSPIIGAHTGPGLVSLIYIGK